MYCPQCGVEYRTGFTQCSDCRVTLVTQKPQMRKPSRDEDLELETVFESSDAGEISSAKRLLDEAGIPFHVTPEEHLFRVQVTVDFDKDARAVLDLLDVNEETTNEVTPAPDPDLALVTVLETNDPFVIALAKERLERSRIPFCVLGEELTVRYGPIGGSLLPVRRFQVSAERAVEVRDLLEDLPFLQDRDVSNL